MLLEDHLVHNLKASEGIYPVINLAFNVLFPECFCPSYRSKFTLFCDFDSIIFEEFCADCIRVLSFIMRMVFAGFVQYLESGPLSCRCFHHFSHLPVIRLQSYCLHTIPVSLNHLQFHCFVLVSMLMWIRHIFP